MFSKIKEAISKFNLGIADKKAIEELIKEIQKNLIRADVDISVVFEMSENIRKKAKQTPKPGISVKEHIINCVYEELVHILGDKKPVFSFKKEIIVLAGLYGSGKTTSAVKLSAYLNRNNLTTGLICADLDRPAAYEQLKQFAKNAEVFGINDCKNKKGLINLLNEGINYFSSKDVIIVDTAGRSSFDNELKKELKTIIDICKSSPNRIAKTLLVCSGDIGKSAKNLALSFRETAENIDGIILTKMDSSAKGGGAISSCYGAKTNVLFIGTGEKIEDFEEYDPIRYVSRILGMGDLQGLIEKVQNAVSEKDIQDMMEGELNMNTFYMQIKNITKMGSFSKIFEMIPGFGNMKIPKNMIEHSEKNIKKYAYIIDSMTKKEKLNPEIIDRSRIERIAKGAGVDASDVKELLRQFRMMKKMMKKMQNKSFIKGKFANLFKNIGQII